MEPEVIPYSMKFTSRLILNQGTMYIHIPKDLATVARVRAGDVAECTIQRIYRPKEEKKK